MWNRTKFQSGILVVFIARRPTAIPMGSVNRYFAFETINLSQCRLYFKRSALFSPRSDSSRYISYARYTYTRSIENLQCRGRNRIILPYIRNTNNYLIPINLYFNRFLDLLFLNLMHYPYARVFTQSSRHLPILQRLRAILQLPILPWT